MEKFKPFRDGEKAMISLSVESRLAEIEKGIPQTHLARLVKEVVFLLDTSAIEARYSFDGQKSYHPKLLLCVLIYGYSSGLRSSRDLADKCRRDDYYKFLMQLYEPDHRTISDFRKDHLELISGYFVDILRIFDKLGYTKMGKIYIDGTKVKANASAKRTKSKDSFERWLGRLENEISQLLQEAANLDKVEDEGVKLSGNQELLSHKLEHRAYLKNKINDALTHLKDEDKRKLNLTDISAANMKKGGSKDIRPGYNCQAAVTEDGVITAAAVVAECNDKNQLEPMLEASEQNTGQDVCEVVADSGYGSYDVYEYLEKRGIDGHVPDDTFGRVKSGEFEKEKNRYHYRNFKYQEESDSYICPEGHRLNYLTTRKRKKGTNRLYTYKIYRGTACSECDKRHLCTKSKKRGRELKIELRESLLRAMQEKVMSAKGGVKYFKRHYTIEPIFGHLKHNLGFSYFLLRGLDKVLGEFKLMCMGWNLQKLLKLGFTPQMVAEVQI